MAGKKKVSLPRDKAKKLPSPALLVEMQRRYDAKQPQFYRKSYDAYQGEQVPEDRPRYEPRPVVQQYAQLPEPVEYPLRSVARAPYTLENGKQIMLEQQVPVIGPLDEYQQEAYDRARRNLFLDMREVKGPQY